jgi:glycosyltransferase involved in cell wall biosynthesis
MIAAETGARVAIIVMGGRDGTHSVGHYGPIAVIRLPGSRRRGTATNYLIEYVDFLLKAGALIRRDHRFRHARIYHVHSLPDFLVAATRSARRFGARVILDLHEAFPEFTRSKFSGWKGRWGERLALRLERWSRRQADVVLTVNHAVAELLVSRPAKRAERVLVVHNFADPGEFGERRMSQGDLGDITRLVYHGTLTPLYGLDLAIEGVRQAHTNGIAVQFDIYGDGPARERLRQQIASHHAGGYVRLCGVVPHHQLRETLTRYDAGLVPTRLDRMTRFSLSTKLVEYIHLGLPILLPSIPTYLRYFPNDTAWYFEPNSGTAISDAIARFVGATPAERVRRAEGAQLASMRELNPDRDAAALKNLYEQLLGPIQDR